MQRYTSVKHETADDIDVRASKQHLAVTVRSSCFCDGEQFARVFKCDCVLMRSLVRKHVSERPKLRPRSKTRCYALLKRVETHLRLERERICVQPRSDETEVAPSRA